VTIVTGIQHHQQMSFRLHTKV